jgi:hypothetical protein
LERIEAHIARRDDVIVDNKRAYDDLRFSLRQDSLRNEKVLGEISQSMARLTGNLDTRTDDMIAENRAQREALFRMLDCLDGKGDSPPST